MILVIPYKDCGNNGHELRYCIRSMVKHFKDLTGVCLIGDKPTWFTGEHIQAADIPGRKEWSIVSKILISSYENFLLSSDDCFALQDFDSTLPRYYSVALKDYKGGGNYPERVRNTMRIYPDGMMYDCHKPMVVNLSDFKDAHNLMCEWGKREYLTKSIYGNFIKNKLGRTNDAGQQLDDYKIKTGKVVDMTRPFFSTNNLTGRLINFDELYPIPSPYES